MKNGTVNGIFMGYWWDINGLLMDINDMGMDCHLATVIMDRYWDDNDGILVDDNDYSKGY